MNIKKNKFLGEISEYYSEKIKEFGTTSKGVDWNTKDSQYQRFSQLTKVIKSNDGFNILDYGCGYGELFNYLNQQFEQFNYTGYDISEEMLKSGKNLLVDQKRIKWSSKISEVSNFDYVVASGIFNVKLESSPAEWLEYVESVLNQINKISEKGFSFNMLTSYSDKDLMKEYLFYASPEQIFKYCKENFAKNVALLHDYNLYEFTVLVTKD